MARSRNKRLTPEQLVERAAQRRAEERQRARDPGAWGVNAEALAAQPDVAVVKAERGKVQTAQRFDVFHTMHARGGLSTAALHAVRRLERDMAERRGVVVDEPSRGGGVGASDHVTQRMIDAGARVDAALSQLQGMAAAVLRELLDPRLLFTNDADRWRAVVRLVTKQARREDQAKIVRISCEALAVVYREADARPRRAA